MMEEAQAGPKPDTKGSGPEVSDDLVESVTKDMDFSSVPEEARGVVKREVAKKLSNYERGIEKKFRQYEEELDDIRTTTKRETDTTTSKVKEEVAGTFDDMEEQAETPQEIRAVKAIRRAFNAELKKLGIIGALEKLKDLDAWKGLKTATDTSAQTETVRGQLESLRKDYGPLVEKYERRILEAAKDPKYVNVSAERFLMSLATPTEIRQALASQQKESKETKETVETKKQASQPQAPARTERTPEFAQYKRKDGRADVRKWMKENLNMGEIRRKAGLPG